MEVKDYIQVHDNCINIKTLCNFLKFINTINFERATVGGKNHVNTKIRNTHSYGLTTTNESLSDVHWHNYLLKFLNKAFLNYASTIDEVQIRCFEPLQLLKYEKGGFYRKHVDHFTDIPRTLSFIYFLNNDYEGGELIFKLGTGDIKIENKPNRLVIWPSNYLYPHEVTTVTKGTRYSLVTWAL
tara:strand:- start:1126 stop:1677 length:552 start_codon:yes stop_codon:yes gene_type:complete